MSYMDEKIICRARAKIPSLKEIKEKVQHIARLLKFDDVNDYVFESKHMRNLAELKLRNFDYGKLVIFNLVISSGEIQEDKEYTFTVNNPSDFVEFIEKMGFTLSLVLHQHIEVYTYEDLTIEIASTKEVGNLIELKIHSSIEKSMQSKEKVMNIARKLGIEQQLINSSEYFKILTDKAPIHQGSA